MWRARIPTSSPTWPNTLPEDVGGDDWIRRASIYEDSETGEDPERHLWRPGGPPGARPRVEGTFGPPAGGSVVRSRSRVSRVVSPEWIEAVQEECRSAVHSGHCPDPPTTLRN